MGAFIPLALAGAQMSFADISAHSKAVAGEAATLNSAVPRYRDTLTQIFSAVNNGQLDPVSAASYVDQALSTYRQQVAPIIKDSGDYAGDTRRMHQCNGPCTVFYDWIQPDSVSAKHLLSQTAGGSITLSSIPANAGFSGAQSVTLTYSPRAVGPGPGVPVYSPPAPPAPGIPVSRLLPPAPIAPAPAPYMPPAPAPVPAPVPAADPLAQLKELLQLDTVLHPVPAAAPVPAPAAGTIQLDSTTLLLLGLAVLLLL